MLSYIQYFHNYCKNHLITLETITIPIGSEKTSAVVAISNKTVRNFVLFVHGLGHDRYYPFTEIFIDLLENGYSILSLDLNGHGVENKHVFN